MKKIISFFLSLIVVTFLFGCRNKTYTLSRNTTTSKETTITTTNVEENKEILNYYKLSKYGYLDWYYLNSIGSSKFIVIPVNYEPRKSAYDDNILDDINEAYFSDGSLMNFESVKSFYSKSSYGKLELDGIVTGWTKPFSKTDLLRNENALIEYTSEFLIENGIDTKDYDLDENGYIDLVIYLYSAPVYENDITVPEYFWAYTDYYESSIPDLESPKVNNYSFISMDFLYDEEGNLDAHTLIHEFGHALGLDDYYDNETNLSPDPVGKTTMMSYNVQDLDMFSKLALGWVDKPSFFNGSVLEYELIPYQDSPSLLVIGKDFNGDAFSEYILMEYYTPTGLNERDALYTFEKMKCVNRPGVRMYHVDARLFQEEIDSYRILKNSSFYKEENGILSIPMCSNTRSYSPVKDSIFDELNEASYYKLIELIDKSGISHIENDYVQNENSYFYDSDCFDLSSVFFHTGYKVDYSVAFKTLENGNMSVVFSKNE